jgi:hypothetical protein
MNTYTNSELDKNSTNTHQICKPMRKTCKVHTQVYSNHTRAHATTTPQPCRGKTRASLGFSAFRSPGDQSKTTCILSQAPDANNPPTEVQNHTRSSSLLAGGLVEPCPHVRLPVLLEVAIGDDIVVLHHDASPADQARLA